MELNITDKVVIVTGAANGIGKVIAETLAEEKTKLVLWDVDAENLKKLHGQLLKKNVDAIYSVCDVRYENEVKTSLESAIKSFGRIDVLVANAGTAHFSKVTEMKGADWDKVFAVNTRGVFNCSKLVAKEMIKNNTGRIIIASSFAAIIPSALSAAYASSKSALISFTRVLAAELGQYNITVNAYAPGMIPTNMSGVKNMSDERQEELLDTLSIREWGRAEDIASLIIFLSSDNARYITGSHIDASGGKFSVQFAKYAR